MCHGKASIYGHPTTGTVTGTDPLGCSLWNSSTNFRGIALVNSPIWLKNPLKKSNHL